MIVLTATDLSRTLADDLAALRALLSEFEALCSRAEPCPEIEVMHRHTAKLRLMVAELPMRIAGHGPFKNSAHVLRCAQAEARRVLIALTEAELFMKTLSLV